MITGSEARRRGNTKILPSLFPPPQPRPLTPISQNNTRRLISSGSSVQATKNPLSAGAPASAPPTKRVSTSTANASPITGSVLASLEAELKAKENNEHRLEHLEAVKGNYLFSVKQIVLLMNMTPSIKTKMGVVEMLAPRCIDPKNPKAILEQVSIVGDVVRNYSIAPSLHRSYARRVFFTCFLPPPQQQQQF